MNLKRVLIFLSLVMVSSIILSGCCGLFVGSDSAIEQDQTTNPPSTKPTNHETTIGNTDEGDTAATEAPFDSYTEPAVGVAPLVESGKDESGGNGTGSAPMATQAPYVMPPWPEPPVDEPRDMFFEDYGVNPFIDTEDDNLSTFSSDVDTGSYTLMRSYINQGFLPPEDSVRVEEYINYFPQGYPLPSAREVFGIYIDGAPAPFTETERYEIIRIGIQGFDIDESDRKDASLTFVIDVSGSMGNGNRLEMVQDALAILVDQLRSTDMVTIVAYTDTAWVVLPPTSARHSEEIKEAVYSLYPMASTNAEAGLILGYQEATEAYNPNGINRVILLSDGVANVGNTGSDSIWESIQNYASEGITLTTVGVGMGNYNDVLLEQLADHGNGFYAYVDTLDEAERLFVHDLVSTLQVIAFDAKIQVEFNPDVVSRYRLIGFENRDIADEDFRDNSVDAAEIGAGHTVTALYEIKLYNNARGEIATVHLRWKDAESYKIREISETFTTRDLEESFRQADPYFQLDVLVAEFGEILRDSYWAEDTSFEDVIDYAEDLPDILERAEVYEFLDLLQQASYLAPYR